MILPSGCGIHTGQLRKRESNGKVHGSNNYDSVDDGECSTGRNADGKARGESGPAVADVEGQRDHAQPANIAFDVARGSVRDDCCLPGGADLGRRPTLLGAFGGEFVLDGRGHDGEEDKS